MAKIKKLLALILSICVICTVSVMSVSGANTDEHKETSTECTNIERHFGIKHNHSTLLL